MGLINCSPALSVIIFRSSQEVKKILLYKNIDCRDISSDQGKIYRLKQHTSHAMHNAKWAINHTKYNPALSGYMV